MFYAERLRLRPVDRPDLPLFVNWINDPEVRTTLAYYLPISQTAEEKWFEKALQGVAEEQPFVIEITVENAWQPIGGCGFHFLDWHNRSAAIGLFIGNKSQWDKGYGTETVRLLIAHAFQTLNLNRIWLKVFESNARGIRAYEKAGFVREGIERAGVYRKGRYENVHLMSILKAETENASS
jgi:RimJ/RimL family protein N-acetyltransferase